MQLRILDIVMNRAFMQFLLYLVSAFPSLHREINYPGIGVIAKFMNYMYKTNPHVHM